MSGRNFNGWACLGASQRLGDLASLGNEEILLPGNPEPRTLCPALVRALRFGLSCLRAFCRRADPRIRLWALDSRALALLDIRAGNAATEKRGQAAFSRTALCGTAHQHCDARVSIRSARKAYSFRHFSRISHNSRPP